MLITFGIIDFSICLDDQQVITNASREGARAGIVANSARLTTSQIQDVVTAYCQNHSLITFGDSTSALETPTVLYPDGCTNAHTCRREVQVKHDNTFLYLPIS
jgi:Flp pilus assembly protein TadG